MTPSNTTPEWQVGDIADPGLQRWLRKKVKGHLFITQVRIEEDDLVQELNLHLIESLALYESSDKTWPHFCRSLVFRKIRHAHQPWANKTKHARTKEAAAEIEQPKPTQKGPTRAEPRPEPSWRLSRLLASKSTEEVAEETEIPAATLLAPIPRLRQAMQRRYPDRYPKPDQNIGYRGMIRWEPPSTLPQPATEEPTIEQGFVIYLNPNKPARDSRQGTSKQEAPNKQNHGTKGSAKKATTPKPARKRIKTRKRRPTQTQQNRLEKKRAKRRLARPTRHRKKPNPKQAPTQTQPRSSIVIQVHPSQQHRRQRHKRHNHPRWKQTSPSREQTGPRRAVS